MKISIQGYKGSYHDIAARKVYRVSLLHSYPKEDSKIQPIKTECEDAFGEIIKKTLTKENLRLIPHKCPRSKIHTILVNKQTGSRTIIKDTVNSKPIQNISKRLLQMSDLIIMDRHEPLAFEEVLARKQKKTKIIIDPSTEVSIKALKMIRLSDYPILPLESLTKIRRHEGFLENIDKLYEIAGKDVVITAGRKGSLIYNGKILELVPSFKVKVTDTLGAGDIFRGALWRDFNVFGWETELLYRQKTRFLSFKK